ncbi:PKD domain-containing protein [Planctomycetota bacterium]
MRLCSCVPAVLTAVLLAGFTVQASEKPQVYEPFAILEGPPVTVPGSELRFSAESSFDLDGTIAAYEFAVDGEAVEADGAVLIVRFSEPGRHSVELTVSDDEGNRATVRRPVVIEPLLAHVRRRLEARERRGVLLFMCEGQDRKTSEAIEELGERVLGPALSFAYGEVSVIRGDNARPEVFFKAIRELATRREVIDLILLAHGAEDKMCFKGRRSASGADVIAELKGRGGEKIRMIYSSLCWGATMNEAWRKVGARAVSGAVHVHIPVDVVPFVLGWLAGEEYGSLVGKSVKFNMHVHTFRNSTARSLRPMVNLLRQNLGSSGPGRALAYYLKWFAKDKDWEMWKSYLRIEGGGVTIDTFREDSDPG